MTSKVEEYILELNEQLKHNSDFKTISISYSFKDDKGAFLCSFTDAYDYKDKVSLAVKINTFEHTKEVVDTWIHHIVYGVRAVRDINNLIKEYQKDKGSPVRIIYKFGYACEDAVKVIDWDYNKIVIKLNKKAISNLVNYSNNLNDIINLDDYNYSIVKIINNFNRFKLHNIIGAELIGDTLDILSKNMLDRKDILQMISEKAISKGTQKVKSVFIIHELKLISIFIWDIDFDTGIVSTTLMENKILDVSEDMYIRDIEICRAIHSIYEIKAKEMSSIFEII